MLHLIAIFIIKMDLVNEFLFLLKYFNVFTEVKTCKEGSLGLLLTMNDYVITPLSEGSGTSPSPQPSSSSTNATTSTNTTQSSGSNSTSSAPVTPVKTTSALSQVLVGQAVSVTCKDTWQIFYEDKWDADPLDNELTILCKPDETFNVPIVKLPPCWAKCSPTKPKPLDSDKLVLNTTLTEDGVSSWQGDKIWYTCTDSDDGLEVLGPEGEMEGSNDQTVAYECDAKGDYTVPETGFRRCLPRRKFSRNSR